jgi:hypothetical protein
VGLPRSERGRFRFRAALAGGLGAVALAAGAGVAYATSTGSQVVETGYATVLEPGSAAYDCPEDGRDTEADAQ